MSFQKIQNSNLPLSRLILCNPLKADSFAGLLANVSA
jgi:hypothetical protein